MGNFDSASDSVKIADLMGALVLVTPTEHLSDVQTADYGPKDPILADIVVLTNGVDQAEEYFDAMIFQGQLIAALRRKLPVTNAQGVVTTAGKNLLGVVALGSEKKKGNFPFVFGPPSAEQRAIAEAWFAAGNTTRAAVIGEQLPWVTESVRMAAGAAGPLQPSPAYATPVQAPAYQPTPSGAVASPDDPWAVG